MRKGISFLIVDFGKAIGDITAVVHNISRIFDILLPTIFETARAVFPQIAEIKLITSSGALEPNATIVNQITNAEIPNFLATLLAHSTNKSDHFIKNINQKINNK
jgi:hypothetical protein